MTGDVLEPTDWGLIVSVTLQGWGMARFIKRPHVAMLIFICLARRKLFPERKQIEICSGLTVKVSNYGGVFTIIESKKPWLILT